MFGRVNGPPAPPGGPPPQPNWLQEWSSRTPLLCRCIIYSTALTGLLSWLLTLTPYLQLLPYLVMARGEVWRLLSGILLQGGIIGLFFVVFTSAIQLPPFELKRGTLPFLLHLLVNALIINILYAALGMALGLVVTPAFAVIPGQGLWPVLLMVIAEDKLLDPTGETPFLCMKLNNRMYPWCLALVFSLISFFPLLDLFLGCALAHAHHANLLKWLTPTARRLESWETSPSSPFVRLGMTRALGYVYAPTSTIPPGQSSEGREGMAQFWSTFSLGGMMRGQQQQGGGGGNGQQQQQQQPTMGGGSVFRTGNGGGGGSGGASATSVFSGEGHSMGRAPTYASSASSSSSAAAAAFGAGGGGGGGGGATTTPMDAIEKRRLLAAAVESRLSAIAGRGVVGGGGGVSSSNSTSTTTASTPSTSFPSTTTAAAAAAAAAAAPTPSLLSPTTATPLLGGVTTSYSNSSHSEEGEGEEGEGEEVSLLLQTRSNGNDRGSSSSSSSNNSTGGRNPTHITTTPAQESTASRGGGDDWEIVGKLVEMGFEKTAAERALKYAGGDLAGALDFLSSDDLA